MNRFREDAGAGGQTPLMILLLLVALFAGFAMITYGARELSITRGELAECRDGTELKECREEEYYCQAQLDAILGGLDNDERRFH